MSPDIRRIREAELPAIVDTMSTAFYGEPWCSTFFQEVPTE